MIKSAKQILAEHGLTKREAQRQEWQRCSNALTSFVSEWLANHSPRQQLHLHPVSNTDYDDGFVYSETEEEGKPFFQVNYDYMKCRYSLQMLRQLGFSLYWLAPFYYVGLPSD